MNREPQPPGAELPAPRPSGTRAPGPAGAGDDLLRLDGLSVGFPDRGVAGWVEVLRGVTFTVRRGECFALVGESGCGKSLTALAILGLLPAGARHLGGAIHLAGAGEVTALPEAARRQLRGRRVAMVFQDPMSALNPVLTIGFQIAEVLRLHKGLGRGAARRGVEELLCRVAMPEPRRRMACYPHELSGGQCQRALLALALACGPELLIADEPTTALDVTVQAQILELIASVRHDLGLTVLLITHDLGVVAQCADRAAVMYAGEVVEQADVGTLFDAPAHPYTRALLRTVPRLGSAHTTLPIAGQVPEPGSLPEGCSFHPRCPEAFDRCRGASPAVVETASGQQARCFLYADGGGAT